MKKAVFLVGVIGGIVLIYSGVEILGIFLLIALCYGYGAEKGKEEGIEYQKKISRYENKGV